MKLQTKKALLVYNRCKNGSSRTTSKRYLTQKCGTHQIWLRIARGHFQGQIFAKSSFGKGSFSVKWKTGTGVLILAFLKSIIAGYLMAILPNPDFTSFFKSYCDHGCFWAKYLSNHFFNNFVVYKHVSVVYFHTNFFKVSTSSHWQKHPRLMSSTEVKTYWKKERKHCITTLKALQCTNSKILIALMTLMLTNGPRQVNLCLRAFCHDKL